MKTESKNYLDQAVDSLNKALKQSELELNEALSKMTPGQRKQFDEMRAKINTDTTGFANISDFIKNSL